MPLVSAAILCMAAGAGGAAAPSPTQTPEKTGMANTERPAEEALTLSVYPAEYGRGNVLPVVRQSPNFLRLMLMGDATRIPGEILLDLPQGLGDYGLLERLGPVTHEGRPYTRFRIPLDPAILASLKPARSSCSVTVWLDATTVKDGESLYFRSVIAGRKLTEKQVSLRVLDPLVQGPRPRRFHGFFCWALFDDVPQRLRASVYHMVRDEMGVDVHLLSRPDPTGWTGYLADRFAADGGQLWANIPGAYAMSGPQKGWETRIIRQGKTFFARDDGYYQALASKVSGAFWDWEPPNALRNPLWDDPATVQAFAEREGLDPVTLDADQLQGPLRQRFLAFRTWQLAETMRLWAAYVHDVDPDWTIAICQGAGIPADRHVDYRSYADIPSVVHLPMIYTSDPMSFARNVAALHRYLPGARIIPVTSTGMVADKGWPAARTPRGIYFDFVTSALAGSIGCGHWPDLNRGLDMEYVWEIARAMRDIGLVEPFLFDGERNPEGLSVRPLPEAEETIQTQGAPIHLTSPRWDRYALEYAFRLDDRLLVALCNLHERKPATVEVRLSGYSGPALFAFDPITGSRLVPETGETWSAHQLDRGLLYEVPPQSLGMLVLSPDPSWEPSHGTPAGAARPSGPPPVTRTMAGSSAATSHSIHEEKVRARYQARCRAVEAHDDLRGMSKEGLEIGWADMDGDGNAEIRLASSRQELGFGPSGNLWCWRLRGPVGEFGSEDSTHFDENVDAGRVHPAHPSDRRGAGAGDAFPDLVNHFDHTGACVDQFWWPTDARGAADKSGEYELVSRRIEDGRATVIFRRALSHWSLSGLVLEKAYSIARDGTELQVRVTVINESPEPREFAYWSHNCLAAGSTPTLLMHSVQGDQLFTGDAQPGEVWAHPPDLPRSQRGLLHDTEVADLANSSFVLGAAPSPRIEIRTDGADFLQLYRWWDGTNRGRYTLEWIYRKQTLETHQSWTTTYTMTVEGG